jgi:hypothetical protein
MTPPLQRFIHGQHGGQRLVINNRQKGGAAGLIAALGGDREQRLAVILDQALGEHRLVVAMGRADVVDAGNIGCRDDQHDAVRRPDRIEIEAGDAGMGMG